MVWWLRNLKLNNRCKSPTLRGLCHDVVNVIDVTEYLLCAA